MRRVEVASIQAVVAGQIFPDVADRSQSTCDASEVEVLIDMVCRLVSAFVLGAAIGLERQWRQRIAGVRTNALVATGAAMFVSLASLSNVGGDSTRIAAQVVSGIGFLGAGVIIRDGLNIRGLNTAATLWCAAGVGVLAGSGYYAVALVGVCLVLAANLGLRRMARRFDRPDGSANDETVLYVVRVVCRDAAEQRVRAHLLAESAIKELRLQGIQSEDHSDTGRVEVTANLLSRGPNPEIVEHIVAHVSLDEAVSAVRWEVGMSSSESPETLMEEMADVDRERGL